MLSNGESALLLPAGDVAGLAGAVQRVIRDTALARRLGEAARRRTTERYTLKRHLGEVESLFMEIVPRARASAEG